MTECTRCQEVSPRLVSEMVCCWGGLIGREPSLSIACCSTLHTVPEHVKWPVCQQILWLLGDTAGALPRSCRHCSWCLPGPQRQDIMAGERSYRSSVEIGPGTVYHVLLSCIVTCTLSYTTPALLVFLMCQECAAIYHACFCQIPQKMLLEERLAI